VILGVDELPEPTKVEEGINAYSWHIDTKYYTTDVNLCSVENKTLASEEFAMSVEAVVIHFDSNKVFINGSVVSHGKGVRISSITVFLNEHLVSCVKYVKKCAKCCNFEISTAVSVRPRKSMRAVT
jgi:hypothetical protein